MHPDKPTVLKVSDLCSDEVKRHRGKNLILIQEPYKYQNKIVRINKYKVFTAEKENID
jgi:hypothetical protein